MANKFRNEDGTHPPYVVVPCAGDANVATAINDSVEEGYEPAHVVFTGVYEVEGSLLQPGTKMSVRTYLLVLKHTGRSHHMRSLK